MAQRTVDVRPERQTDSLAIARVHRAAFPTPLEVDLVDRMREGGELIASLVATSADEIIGHIAFSSANVIGETRTAKVAWLAPLAVLPEYQSMGIGSRLAEAGVVACTVLGLDGVVVYGAPNFYGRFGFSPKAAQALTSRFAGPALMAHALGGGSLAGTLTEPRAFSLLA